MHASTAVIGRSDEGERERPLALHERLEALFRDELPATELMGHGAHDVRDELLTLSRILDLHLAPIDRVRSCARWQHHPIVSGLKQHLEQRFLWRLALDTPPAPVPSDAQEAVAQLRSIAHDDAVPEVYDWLANEADRESVRRFLEIEGGPDGGFDDLVAIAQVGLRGNPKLEMARNYWDEMGRGSLEDVHTELHASLSGAFDLHAPDADRQPVPSLERGLLNAVLATNRYLQPELVGALGLIELQAGPRCRRVVRALERVGAPAGAFPFYEEHATTDPWHGKAWLDHVVTPLASDPWWAGGIVRGAQWRSLLNTRFFASLGRALVAA